jgi:hypothetical protein
MPNIKTIYRIIVTSMFLLKLNTIQAQFTGSYAVANWGTVAVNSDGQTNTTGAPTSISMTSGDNQSGTSGTNDFTITAPLTGLITFSWTYSTSDGPFFDYPLFGVNNTFSTVNGFSNAGGNSQSGSQPCVSVNQGDVFRFRMFTTDNIVGPATCVFSNFSFSTGSLTVTPASPSVCPGNTLALTASGGSNYSWSGGISNGVAFTPTASGVYTVTSGTGLCITSKTVFVTYNPPLSIIGPTSNICTNSPATLIASGGTTYSWSTGSTASSITVVPAVNTTYTVFGTSNAGCNTQGVQTVTVDFTPTITAVSSNTTNGSCPNAPLTLNGSGGTTYTWTGGITNGVAFSPTVSATYVVTGFNACGSSTAVISVSIHPIPPVTANANNTIICSGSSVILNGGGALTYTWTPNVPNNTAFFPTSTQNYTVRGTSALGCTASAVQVVAVIITPSITPIVTPTAICFGATATLSAVGATGYTWTPGSNPNTQTLVVSPPSSTTYTLVRTNGPCSNTSTVNLVINPLPLLIASATPSQICAGTGVAILIFGPITNTTFPAGFTQSSFTVFPNSSINYTIVGSNGNCTTSAVVPVVVNQSPVISISSSTTTICQGQNATLTANGTGVLTYTWLPLNSNNTSVVVSPPTPTIITFSATNASNCTSTQNQLIIVDPLPNMNITSSAPFVCANQSAVLSVTNPSTMVVYNWNTGATGTSIQVNPLVTTSYFATGVNTVTGCQNTNTVTLSVFISTFVVSSPTAICKGQTATLTANGPATTYSWSVNGGITAPSVTVSPAVTTVYNVTGSNVSCSNTETVNLIVHPIPNVTAVLAKTQICRFEVSTITGNGANTYSWNTGATTQTLSTNLSVTTTFTLTGKDLNNCSKTVTVTQFVATCIGIDEATTKGQIGLQVYPNPNNGNFTISSDVNITLRIMNVLGQELNTLLLTEENQNKVTVSSLPNGIYFVSGETKGLKVNKKIIVER